VTLYRTDQNDGVFAPFTLSIIRRVEKSFLDVAGTTGIPIFERSDGSVAARAAGPFSTGIKAHWRFDAYRCFFAK
jgi:hypothetical protein